MTRLCLWVVMVAMVACSSVPVVPSAGPKGPVVAAAKSPSVSKGTGPVRIVVAWKNGITTHRLERVTYKLDGAALVFASAGDNDPGVRRDLSVEPGSHTIVVTALYQGAPPLDRYKFMVRDSKHFACEPGAAIEITLRSSETTPGGQIRIEIEASGKGCQMDDLRPILISKPEAA
jgi:hypothetical protein